MSKIKDKKGNHKLFFFEGHQKLTLFASAIATSNDEALNQLIFPSSPPFLPLSKSD